MKYLIGVQTKTCKTTIRAFAIWESRFYVSIPFVTLGRGVTGNQHKVALDKWMLKYGKGYKIYCSMGTDNGYIYGLEMVDSEAARDNVDVFRVKK